MLTSKKIVFFFLIFCLNLLKTPQIKAEKTLNPCQDNSPLASYELENDWVYICSSSEDIFFLKFNKNDPQNILKIPASGGFPTYAAVEGELSDPNSKIYNISPFYFQTIESSIITNIKPVLRTFNHSLKVQITPLSNNKKEEALAACENYQPVQAFETEKSNVYICIETKENNDNAIDLIYVQKDKSNSTKDIRLKTELISSFEYKTSSENETNYIVSYKGLETYKNGIKVNTEAINHVYLIPSVYSDTND